MPTQSVEELIYIYKTEGLNYFILTIYFLFRWLKADSSLLNYSISYGMADRDDTY